MRAIIWAAVSTKKQAAEGKNSIQSQVHDARLLCREKDWHVIDELIVPGFSRNYVDIQTFASEAAREGIDAGQRLLQHFKAQDYDILIVRDGDRFGRTQTMFSYVVESTIQSGGQVYSFADGMIHEGNYRLWIAMGGYRAAGEIDSLRKKQQMGYRAKIQQGLPMNATVARSHKIIRDEQSGKVIGVEVDDNRRQEFLDLATLILEGVAWGSIEREMYERFGYARDLPGGGAQASSTYYRLLYTPSFWGHVALKARNKMFSAWSREDGHPIPDGVTVNYDVFEPMYTGKLADQIKAELTRREQTKGKQKPAQSYKFSGLILCAECGYRMIYTRNGNYRGIRCQSRWVYAGSRPNCSNHTVLNERHAIEQIDTYLIKILEFESLDPFIEQNQQQEMDNTLQTIQAEIDTLTDKIAVMIHKQADAPPSTQSIYDEQIRNLASRLDILRQRQQILTQDHVAMQATKQHQKHAFKDIQQLNVSFWELPDNQINQLLLQILGNYRFMCSDGQIIALTLPIQ